MVGTTISHYKFIEKIGQGGMGEVYRAEDTNLSREGPLKCCPSTSPREAHNCNNGGHYAENSAR